MNTAHIHLLITHVPILGGLFGAVLLGFGLILKSLILRRAGLLTLVAAALVAIPAFLTGEGAEEIVEKMPGVSHSVIHAHEELAELVIWLTGGLGGLALIGFLFSLKDSLIARVLAVIIFMASIGNFVMIARVGNLGGKIRHTEIRDSGQPGNAEQPGIRFDDDD
jgi:hypothetical protein